MFYLIVYLFLQYLLHNSMQNSQSVLNIDLLQLLFDNISAQLRTQLCLPVNRTDRNQNQISEYDYRKVHPSFLQTSNIKLPKSIDVYLNDGIRRGEKSRR